MHLSARPRGLSAFSLKCIALICMTLDHIHVYLYRVYPLPIGLRVAGRLAAPIFIYLICWSFDYTRSRPRFLLRLYLCSLVMELVAAAVNALFPDPPGYPLLTDIFITMFAILFSLYLIEQARAAVKGGRRGRALACLGALGGFYLCSFWLPGVLPYSLLPVAQAVLPLPAFANGGLPLVLFGIGLYYVKGRTGMLAVYYGIYSILSIWLNAPLQFYMVLALPLLLCYNQQRGPDIQAFFYLYYPLHSYVLFLLGVLLGRAG